MSKYKLLSSDRKNERYFRVDNFQPRNNFGEFSFLTYLNIYKLEFGCACCIAYLNIKNLKHENKCIIINKNIYF